MLSSSYDTPTGSNIVVGADSPQSWLWLCLSLVVYRVGTALLTYVLGDDRVRSVAQKYLLLVDMKEHLANQICPKRRARYLKCTKRRCEQRRQMTCRQPQEAAAAACEGHCCKEQCDKLCELGKALIKLHLPPPLPFFRRRKCKQQVTSSAVVCCPEGCRCCQCGDDDSSKSSCTSEEATKIPKPAATVASPMKQPRSQSLSPTLLIDMARMQQWPALLQNMTRRGAKYRDPDGLYPLHWACSGSPPVTVMDALIQAYPSAARKVDAEGSTPLHFATHYAASLAVIERVLQAYPKAIKLQDRFGRTPLYHAVEKSSSLEVIKLLTEADASCVLLPCLPKDTRILPTLLTRNTAVRTPLYMAWASALRDRQTRSKCKGKQWDKAEYLLSSVSKRGTLMERLISMDMYLPEQVVTLMSMARPELVIGANALAAAVSARHYSRERSIYLIRLFLNHDPGAASLLDCHGRSILGSAAFAIQPWEVIQELFHAAPQTILWRDGETGLPPALLAATSQQSANFDERSGQGIDQDPYNLLTAKQKELLNVSAPIESSEDEDCQACISADTLHVNTIFSLIQKDPSVILRHRAAGSRCRRFMRIPSCAIAA